MLCNVLFFKKSGIFFHFCSYSCTLLLIIGHILRGNRELRLSVSGLVLHLRELLGDAYVFDPILSDEKGANGPWLSFAGDLASAVAMTAKFVSTERLLGPDLYNAYRELLRDCFWGINGQPMLAASVPARALSVSYASILESVR